MYKQLNLVPIYNIIFYVVLMGVAGCVWGGGGWVSVDRRLFHRCGALVDLELSCLKTLLSLEVKGSSEGILYDEIYIFCMCTYINDNYVGLCSINHYNVGGSHASDIIIYVLMGVSES